jgi:Fic family protein
LDREPGGFEGGMNTRKYVSLTGTSRPTASRELIELNALGVLKQVGGGRSTRSLHQSSGLGARESLDGLQPK